MLQRSVGCQYRVVRLNDRVRRLWCRVDTELQLRLLSVICGQALKQKRAETGASTTSKGMENEKSLQTGAVVCETTNFVHDNVDMFLTHGVMTTSICEVIVNERNKNAGPQGSQLFAASSLPVTRVSGWKRLLYVPVLTSSMTFGSKST